MKDSLTFLNIILMVFVIVVLIYGTGLGYVNIHETIHQLIFKDYGIDSDIEINYKSLSGITNPVNITNISEFEHMCNTENGCLFQHNLNEIIGYNTAVIVFALWFIFAAYFLYKLIFEL